MPVDESMKIFWFLNGLSREYDPVSTVIQSSLSKFPTPTFPDVISEVQGFGAKLKSYEDTSAVSPHIVYSDQPKEGQTEVRYHTPTYNPNYQGRGRSGYMRGRGGYSTRGQGFTQHQSSAYTQGERPTCQICGRVGHTALKCYNRFDNNYQSAEAFASLRVADESGREWLPDSGASAHITSSTSNLQEAHPYHDSEVVMVADGAYLPITHVGSATITSTSGTISLDEVLVCPNIKKSLLSVSKLCEDYPCGVFFDSANVYIIDLQKQRVVSKGPQNKGLYMLKNHVLDAYYSNRNVAASEELWHHRLAHSSTSVLQQLNISKDIHVNESRSPSVCQPCQMGKSSRLQFFIPVVVLIRP